MPEIVWGVGRCSFGGGDIGERFCANSVYIVAGEFCSLFDREFELCCAGDFDVGRAVAGCWGDYGQGVVEPADDFGEAGGVGGGDVWE